MLLVFIVENKFLYCNSNKFDKSILPSNKAIFFNCLDISSRARAYMRILVYVYVYTSIW